ncbi:DUF2207 domain-containing protein [bacterium]|nr:MAG: DUF2207 domain-containing protein [bacterium]
MSEERTPLENHNDIQDAEDAKAEAKRKRAFYWQIYGWSVIGLMILTIVLNMFGLFGPDFNRYIMIGIVVAYGVYIVFRRR